MRAVFTVLSSCSSPPRARRDWVSTARREAEQFDSIRVLQQAVIPFGGAQCDAVVLDENGAFHEAQFGHERRDVVRGSLARLAVDDDIFHEAAMA